MSPEKLTQTTYKQRITVQALRFEAGWTLQKIATNQRLSIGTVWNICNAPPTPKKRTGRPPILDGPTRRRLVFTATSSSENRRKPYAEIAEMCGVKAGEKTLRKAFEMEGYSRGVVQRKQFLKAETKKKRLEFALKWKGWGKEEWRRVLWVDKCYFWLGGEVWVTGRLGEEGEEEEMFKRENSVMIWGGMIGGKKVPLVLWDKEWGAVTAESYKRHILDPILRPLWSEESKGASVWVMEDETSVQRAQQLQGYLEYHNMLSLIWPPSSPDLNSMEYMWNLLKNRLNHRSPRPSSVEEMGEAIKEEWDKIGENELLEFVDSMPERIEAIIAANGGHIQL